MGPKMGRKWGKIWPKWGQNGAKNGTKNRTKNGIKNGAKMISQMGPKTGPKVGCHKFDCPLKQTNKKIKLSEENPKTHIYCVVCTVAVRKVLFLNDSKAAASDLGST